MPRRERQLLARSGRSLIPANSAVTIIVIRPNHRPASAVRSIHYSFVRRQPTRRQSVPDSDRPWSPNRHRQRASHHSHRSRALCRYASSHTNHLTRGVDDRDRLHRWVNAYSLVSSRSISFLCKADLSRRAAIHHSACVCKTATTIRSQCQPMQRGSIIASF